MNKSINNKPGFTLLELLVVISIIGVIIAMGIISYSAAQRKSRDSRRKSDMKAIQNAMEQYFSINLSYGSDPDCSTQIDGYMSAVPTDPKSGSYFYLCSASAYCACAYLEQGGDASAPSSCTGAGLPSGRTGFFCQINLQ